MSAEDRKLLEIAARISDGDPVDWGGEARGESDEEIRRTIRQLRLVEDVAGVYRSSEPGHLSESSPTQMAATLDPRMLGPEEETPEVTQWGRLEIRERLGAGGYGEVFRAFDENLDREVALKLLKPGLARADERAKIVLREGRMLARVRHPNVITVHGAETHDGRVGLWMELVRGRTLSQLLHEQGKFGAREAAVIGLDLCRALAAVHGAGLVHRDVKAQNAMREEGGRILLMDFGAGKEVDDLSEQGRSGVSGTPLYIPPEVYLGQGHSLRSDIYSLGVLLYHLVTGSFPVRGSTFAELERNHREKKIRLLRDERSDLPEPFVQVVERALAWDPDERFETAGRMEQALAQSIGGKDVDPPKPKRSRLPGRFGIGLIAATIVLGLAWVALERFGNVEPRPLGGPVAVSTGTPSSAEAYTVQASLYRKRDGVTERLDSGAALQIGDELSLEIEASRDLHVYIFNEDARGKAFALFPLPDLEVQNPLPGGRKHALPGVKAGKTVRWQVDSAGEREHLIVLASPEPLVEFEDEMQRLARPRTGAMAVPVPEEAGVRLRGIGSIVESQEPEATASAGHLHEMARKLAGQAETVEGVWLREIELENPAP